MNRSSRGLSLFWITLLCFALTIGIAGCSDDADTSDSGTDSSGEQATQEAPESAEEPEYTSWHVYINDDDSYTADGVTYEIALNLTADNPTSDIAGTYTGQATASTSSSGNVGGQQLEASAIANSTQLQFTLEDTTAGGALAPLTEDTAEYSGTGSITMQAEGSGSIGGAGGAFSNNSSQPLQVAVSGSEVTLRISIDGHDYTFTGTISGE